MTAEEIKKFNEDYEYLSDNITGDPDRLKDYKDGYIDGLKSGRELEREALLKEIIGDIEKSQSSGEIINGFDVIDILIEKLKEQDNGK